MILQTHLEAQKVKLGELNDQLRHLKNLEGQIEGDEHADFNEIRERIENIDDELEEIDHQLDQTQAYLDALDGNSPPANSRQQQLNILHLGMTSSASSAEPNNETNNESEANNSLADSVSVSTVPTQVTWFWDHLKCSCQSKSGLDFYTLQLTVFSSASSHRRGPFRLL